MMSVVLWHYTKSISCVGAHRFLFLNAPTWRFRPVGWTDLSLALAWDGLEYL